MKTQEAEEEASEIRRIKKSIKLFTVIFIAFPMIIFTAYYFLIGVYLNFQIINDSSKVLTITIKKESKIESTLTVNPKNRVLIKRAFSRFFTYIVKIKSENSQEISVFQVDNSMYGGIFDALISGNNYTIVIPEEKFWITSKDAEHQLQHRRKRIEGDRKR